MTSATARSPSRRDTRRQTRRETIVQVAAQSFLERGYAGTTMSGIATALGGSKGTLWSYFPSKEELFVAVLDRLTVDFRAQLSLILNPRHEVEAALRRFCRELLVKVTAAEGAALYRLVVSESQRFPEIARIFHDRGPRVTQRQLAAFLADAMERGRLQPGDPQVAARQLIALCLSGSHRRLLTGLVDAVGSGEIDDDVDQAMDLFTRAYAIN